MSRTLAILLLLYLIPRARAQTLPLDAYLTQVKRANTAYQGQLQDSDATLVTSETAALPFTPQLFANGNYIYDTRDTFIPAIEGTRNVSQSGSVGVRKQFDFGLQLQLSLDVNHTTLYGADPNIVTDPSKTIVTPTPYFLFSLWQNWLGRRERANAALLEAQAKASAYGEAYEAKAMLVEAEGRYWKLAVLRGMLRIEKESVERAIAIRELNERKAKRELMDESDVLVAQAAVQGKTLELASMQGEEKSAARLFNLTRGRDSDAVVEELELPSPEQLGAITTPPRAAKRGDVKAAEQATLAANAGSTLAQQKLVPELNLYGSVYAAGISFSMPLDVGTVSDLRQAYAKRSTAAELIYRKKLLDQDAQWKDLVQRFNEAKDRLSIATQLETIQLRKFESIKKRQRIGLTIAYQVFQYELDYLSAALNRVQLEGQILGLRAQMKLYEDEGKP